MEKKNTVLFDPGYAPIVIDSLGQVGYAYYMFNAIPNLKLKRLNFHNTLIKVEHHLKKTVSFYLGCMMWASYIKKFDDYEIEGNQLLGEVCNEEEYTSELNFLIDLLENQIPKDSKYFANKPYVANESYLKILKTYKDFLILNKGFVDCSKTNQILIPENVSYNDLELLNEKIQNAISNKKIELLLEEFGKNFNID